MDFEDDIADWLKEKANSRKESVINKVLGDTRRKTRTRWTTRVRLRVPMRDTGTELFVVVRKRW